MDWASRSKRSFCKLIVKPIKKTLELTEHVGITWLFVINRAYSEENVLISFIQFAKVKKVSVIYVYKVSFGLQYRWTEFVLSVNMICEPIVPS